MTSIEGAHLLRMALRTWRAEHPELEVITIGEVKCPRTTVIMNYLREEEIAWQGLISLDIENVPATSASKTCEWATTYIYEQLQDALARLTAMKFETDAQLERQAEDWIKVREAVESLGEYPRHFEFYASNKPPSTSWRLDIYFKPPDGSPVLKRDMELSKEDVAALLAKEVSPSAYLDVYYACITLREKWCPHN